MASPRSGRGNLVTLALPHQIVSVALLPRYDKACLRISPPKLGGGRKAPLRGY